ncbi:MAG: fatty acid hydroxylase family protein, partial [Halioglobus sp.]
MQETYESIGPLTEASDWLANFIWQDLASAVPHDLQWKIILLTLAIATGIFWARGGRGSRGADGGERKANLLQYLFPKDIYSHTSARVDVGLYVLERLLHPLWAVSLLATVGPATEQFTSETLQFLLGASPALQSNLGWMLLYS